MNILFVCLGNICRSPMAESMFTKMVNDAGLTDQIKIDSAGTSSEEQGNPAHPGTRQILSKYGLPFDNLISRPLTLADFKHADYIICMDDMNLADVKHRAPAAAQHKIYAIFDMIPTKKGQAIPDPWYTHRFQETYDSLAQALPAWLTYLKQQLGD
ncbi:low molecular weight protein-tyrosine-phosphatase [Paucilactobacillus wasatchensis]|uniref:protein-tyrosine-phosphatase n=1 Tax=Paucilactobacillus wasatchensis TaxID=1335616 RepID=A0A0D0YY90_9LACO|nr:low molecular weight protein-tyrosine-phosphatase [Paucilactobacillus wasatchensis]KIS04174.1 Low molecular weight protein tyrosine phosphatase [Paucilactobacillus wasatchensis]